MFHLANMLEGDQATSAGRIWNNWSLVGQGRKRRPFARRKQAVIGGLIAMVYPDGLCLLGRGFLSL